LYVLLYRNVNRRKVFKDVERHYRQLSLSGHSGASFNSFFYVSSSEWNLYSLINRVIERENMPKAVIKLKDIKTGIPDFLFKGHSDHNHKFYKIKDIIAFYPDIRYVLLGDDSQHDPFIYEKICKVFPGSVVAVYMRQSGDHKHKKVQSILDNLETLGVATCYFQHSEKAIEHSRSIGII
ncbi:MAG: App1 family protein, partial [Taibaiella sp.]|nr:App1 family protein [Taibaiella sp.]